MINIKMFKKILLICTAIFLMFITSSCNKKKDEPRIYLYGEYHGAKIEYDTELEAWKNYYNNQNMRHLFMEIGYSSAYILNQWMHADDDTLLFNYYENLKGTQSYCQEYLDFLRGIKQSCPETIIHGTDVGHQYKTNDAVLLRDLEKEDLTTSDEYKIALLNVMQAKSFYDSNHDWAIRENFMAENFIREFNSLPENEKIMGIYGSAHVCYEKDLSEKVPSMINQIRENYKTKNLIVVNDISNLMPEVEVLRVDEFSIKGKNYKASYFGEQDLTGFKDYKCRKYWRIENPDDTLMKLKSQNECLPYDNYIMNISLGDILRVEYTKTDNSTFVNYYRADGKTFENQPCTNLILKE